MRALKISAFLIFLLLGIFFLVGFLNPQLNYQVSIKIDRPLNYTFSLFNNNERITEWLPDVKEITPIQETPDKVGSRYKMVIVNEEEEMIIEETLLQYKKNQLVELEFSAGWMHKINRFEFSKTNGGTMIIASHTIEGQNPVACSLFALFKSTFQDIDGETLNKFKKFAEKQPLPEND